MADMYFENLPSTNTPIIDTNINKLNDVKVSTTQPNTGEKVWIQKGKNLLDKNKLGFGAITAGSTAETLDYNTQAYTTDWIFCTPNTSYTLSGGNRVRWQFKNASKQITYADTITITTPADAKYMRCYCFYDDNNVGVGNLNLQIEEGTNATSYESYIEPTIHIKNDNNVYENFDLNFNIGSFTTATGVYTTARWVDGENTCIWTAPKAGNYIVYIYFYPQEDASARIYKQFQLKGTTTRPLGNMLFYQHSTNEISTAASDKTVVGGVFSTPVIATSARQTIYPYIHSPVAGLKWNVTIVGIYVGNS